ncbi:MAG TPA: histidine kinase [Gaiellaceae bacterium]|nr:histidine kinase [Gaiellaceae bacterium]
MPATRALQALVATSALVLGVLAYQVQVDELPEPLTTTARALAGVLAAWAFLAAGLVAWRRRPGNRLGPLMVATCFALLARQFRYSHDPLAFTVFFLLGELGWVLVAHVALAYPSGRVASRLERRFLGAAYAVATAFPLAILLFHDATRQLRFFDPTPRESLLLVGGNAGLVDGLQKAFAVVGYGVLALLFCVLVARRLVGATPRARRVLAPLLLAAAVAALWALLNGILTFATRPPEIVHNLFWWQVAGLAALPLALLAVLLQARLARAHVGDLVVHLETTPVDGIRDELATVLADPTLELGLWLPERREYVDAAGGSFTLPEDGEARAVTPIEHRGEPLAVLVHDPTLRDEPKLVAAVAAAARLALVNARLHAEVRAQLATVKESRARIAAAADEERRRIERDLHDGAQQRLVALALELRSALRRLGEGGDPELERLLASTADELQVAVEELRSLAHGIHPGALRQGGLASALGALAARAPLPVAVEATSERFPPDVEATAYFLAAEALTNVVKHAGASKAAIRVQRDHRMLVVEVEDDGAGGATPNGGTGLRGLADRVESHGGRLRIESAPGSGTRVVGEIPCAS